MKPPALAQRHLAPGKPPQQPVFRQAKVVRKRRDVDVKVGDDLLRVSLRMPRTLDALRAQLKDLFPAYATFDLWTSPGRKSNLANVCVTTEATYQMIQDQDVVVIVGRDRAATAPLTTSYQDAHRDFGFAGRVPAKPPKAPYAPAPFFGQSTHTRDYLPFTVSPRTANSVPHVHAIGPRKFDGRTTYAHDFIKHKLPDHGPAKDRGARDAGPKFAGVSSYTLDYQPHGPVAPPASRRPAAYRAHANNEPHTRSTYQDEYPAHAHERQRSARRGSVERAPQPFYGSTTYARDYVRTAPAPTPILHVEPEVKRGVSRQ